MGTSNAKASAADAEPPKSTLDKVITSTPVVMTIVATVLAGLSTSEMNQAQYFRATAAQQQSKASDQWALFQAKRGRAADAEQRAELFLTLGEAGPFSIDQVTTLPRAATTTPAATQAAGMLDDPGVKTAAEMLRNPVLPSTPPPKFDDPAVAAAYDALRKNEGETADRALFAKVTDKSLHEALRKAEQRTRESDDALNPIDAGVLKLAKAVDGMAGGTADAAQARRVRASFNAARLKFEDARQHEVAKLNQVTAYLYEISVRRATIESERHRTRSLYFFFGMLGTQAAVTLATIAIAARERSALWVMAAVIGVLAVAYAGYVYLFT